MGDGPWFLVDGPVHGRSSANDWLLARLMPPRGGVKAKTLEDLVVYREAIAAEDAVSAILTRAAFNKDYDLRDQLRRSSSRIAPLIAEGFGQLTDRHVAVYLGRARGSALETTVHLRKTHARQFISDEEHTALTAHYKTIGKRLTKWIEYLKSSNWKDRR